MAIKIKVDSTLFWFLAEGTLLDLGKPSEQDLYVQQTLCRGTLHHVKELLKTLGPAGLQQSLSRIKHYLPEEVRAFWEDYLASH